MVAFGNVLNQRTNTFLRVVACNVTLTDDANQLVVGDDRKPPDLVPFQNFNGGINAGIRVNPVGFARGEIAGHHFAGATAGSDALEHNVAVGDHALQLAVITTNGQ